MQKRRSNFEGERRTRTRTGQISAALREIPQFVNSQVGTRKKEPPRSFPLIGQEGRQERVKMLISLSLSEFV